jgi:hypothetical protein
MSSVIQRAPATKKVWAWGAGSISTGVILVLLALVTEDLGKGNSTFLLLLKLMEHMGLALISIGIVGIIVDFPDWQKYFQERVADTIIHRNYLNTLSKSQLIDLQTDTLKAFHGLDDIDRQGSLIEFFHTRINNHIGSPFRENVQAILSVVPTEDGTGYVVDDIVSYTCRKTGDYIQGQVQWSAAQDEIDKLDEFKVQIRVPQNFFQSPEFKTRYPSTAMDEDTVLIFDSKDSAQNQLVPAKEGHGYTLPLSDFREVDGLSVKISVRYVVPAGRMITWRMTYPSRNVTGVVRFPPDFNVHVEVFGFGSEELNEEDKVGLYTFSYNSWLLPHSGFAFDFRRPERINQRNEEPVVSRDKRSS